MGATAVSTIANREIGVWKGIMHTHPTNVSFSGLGVYYQNGGTSFGLVERDVNQSMVHGVSNYLVLPNHTAQRFNYEAWMRAAMSDHSGE